MPSPARNELQRSLADVEELINAHAALTGGHPGRLAARQGEAVTRAAVVLLCAAMEVYFENLFKDAAELIYSDATAEERNRLYRNTTGRLNHPSLDNVTFMYFSLGLSHPFNKVHWQKMSNVSFKTHYQKLLEARGQVAHGQRPPVRLATVRSWKNIVDYTAWCFDRILAEHVRWMTGTRPNWADG